MKKPSLCRNASAYGIANPQCGALILNNFSTNATHRPWFAHRTKKVRSTNGTAGQFIQPRPCRSDSVASRQKRIKSIISSICARVMISVNGSMVDDRTVSAAQMAGGMRSFVLSSEGIPSGDLDYFEFDDVLAVEKP